MSLRDFVQHSRLVSCSPDTSVQQAARMMEEHNVGALVVTGGNSQPAGIVTDRDIALRCVGIQEGGSLHMAVKDVMTSPVVCCSVDEGITEVIAKMRDRGCRRMPVIDENGKAVGIFSAGDVMEMLVEELSELSAVTAPNDEKLLRQPYSAV